MTINGQNANPEDISPASLDVSANVAELLTAEDNDAIKDLLDVGGGGSGDMYGANNLSELTNTTTARTNLGLGAVATKNVGSGSTNVAAGNDSRFVTNGNSHDHNGGDGGTIAYASISGTPTFPTKVKQEYWFFPAVNDNTLTRTPGNLSTDSGGVSLDQGGSFKIAVAQFANSTTKRVGGNLVVPEDWDGSTVTAEVRFGVGSGGTNGQNVRWELSTAFVADGAAFNPSMNSAQAVTTTVANAANSLLSVTQFSSVTMTGGAAGRMMLFNLERIGGTDTMNARVDLFSLKFVFNVNLTT